MQVYLNGTYTAAASAAVSVFDEGFLFGDGVYTTLRTYAGNPVDLEPHLRRLRSHCRELGLPLRLSPARLREVVARLAAVNDLQEADGRLRVIVSRAGVAPPAPGLGTANLLVILEPVPAQIAAWQERGIAALMLGPPYVRAHFPHLKTLNGLPGLLARRRAAAAGCQEAILADAQGLLLEGTMSNVFVVRGGRILTPRQGTRFLAGLTRHRILEVAAQAGIDALQTDVPAGDLAAADEVFTASSVREVLPVVRIDGRPLAGGSPGPVTRRIQDLYRRRLAATRQG